MATGNKNELRSRSNKKPNKQKKQEDTHKITQSQADLNKVKEAQEFLSEKGTFSFSLLTAFRILLIVRCFSGLFRLLDDCDEVYNYWEPTHYLLQGYGRETWEYSADYKIRSWAYIFVHALIGFVSSIITSTKLQTFYLIRLSLGAACSYAEARFYRTVTEEINPHVGRYVFAILFFGAGMFNASTAYLPSSFAMYCVFMAFSYVFRPVSDVDRSRTYKVVFWIGLGALAGWPFAALIGVPFAIEEVVIFGRDTMKKEDGQTIRSVASRYWRLKRVVRLLEATVLVGAGLVFILVLMDQMFYRSYTVVAWNIIKYNIFGDGSRGPDLYGTEPWYYYILNGFLNFNVVFLLALGSFGCMLVTAYIDRNRVPGRTLMDQVFPYITLGLKLAPFYVWFILFSLQPHKEERFMYVAYPLVAFNAAISIYLVRSWTGRLAGAFGASPQVRVICLRYASLAILGTYALISVSRILALLTRYRAPFVVYSSIFRGDQAPDQITNLNYVQEDYPSNLNLTTKNVCIGKEWYHFPSQFFLPSDTRVQFLKTDFSGHLPQEFLEDTTIKSYNVDGETHEYRTRQYAWMGARLAPKGFNDLNKENPDVYVTEDQCDYLVDVDFPLRPDSPNEPRYIRDNKNWEALECYPYIDNENSHRLSRAFWVPGSPGLEWGDYCMLKRRA